MLLLQSRVPMQEGRKFESQKVYKIKGLRTRRVNNINDDVIFYRILYLVLFILNLYLYYVYLNSLL